ncbi:MAG TPA: putative 2OG-Fe(II) oxygenase [Allosphingosinicella sp.]|nr:putative 2OG-Fe(II) oxygenase [Allosphingosinicella sp.]
MTGEHALRLKLASPDDADALYAAGALAVRNGLEDEALPVVEAAVARHPGDARLWQVLGLARRRREELAPAVAAFGKAAALAPTDALIAHSLARATMEAGLPAMALFERALALAPNDASVLLGQAAARLAEGNLAGAIEGLERVLADNPGWLAGHATAARLRFAGGDEDGLTSSLERAISVQPRELALWRELADVWMHGERYDRVLDVIVRGRVAAGSSVVFDALEAVCAAEQGDTNRADALFAALGPIGHITMAARYMRHLLRAGRPDEASRFADLWADRDPDNFLIPYQSAAWRLTGDPRWQWLEGDERLIGIYDLADKIPSLDALAECLRGLHLSVHHPLEQSLRGGTQTDGPLFSRIEPELRALRAAVVEAVETHVARLPPPDPAHPTLLAKRAPVRFSGSWSVRLAGAGFHVNHVHPAGWLSSAFYAALPEAAMGGPAHDGWLSIGEVSELGLDLAPIRLVEPKPGRLVLFPSTIWHGTRPFSAGERLTVAFDVAKPVQ